MPPWFSGRLLEKQTHETAKEARIVEQSQDRIVNAAFVTFRSRRSATIAAQTQLATNPLVGSRIRIWGVLLSSVHAESGVLGSKRIQVVKRVSGSESMFSELLQSHQTQLAANTLVRCSGPSGTF